MRVLALPLLCVICACGQTEQPFVCRTRCGVELVNVPIDAPGWTCNNLQIQEDEMLEEYTRIDDIRFQSACSLMHGWRVHLGDGPLITDPALSGPLTGVTHCELQESTVGNSPPWESSYPHEMAHAVQNCQPNKCAYTNEDDSHWCWDTNLVLDTLARIHEDTRP